MASLIFVGSHLWVSFSRSFTRSFRRSFHLVCKPMPGHQSADKMLYDDSILV